jgi:hypothetical protein
MGSMLDGLTQPMALLASVSALTLLGCRTAAETGDTVARPAVVEAAIEHELDRTIWDCEWSIAVFWGPHWYRVHRDVAVAVMGGHAIFAREDFDLAYGPAQAFSAAIRYREYPSGQRDPEQLDGPLQAYRYAIDGERLTIHADHGDEPLECTRGCYDQAFIDFMDAHYQTTTSAAAVADKMRASECG